MAATVSTVAASATSVALFAAVETLGGSAQRIVVNDSSAILYVNFGATATAAAGGYTYKLLAGDTLEFPRPVYPGAVNGIWSSAAGGASLTQVSG